jgi:hypothetical protein
MASIRAYVRRLYLAFSLLTIVCFVVLTAGAYHRFEPRNLARGARVTGSAPTFGTSFANVVDGYRYGELGYHSIQVHKPWLSLDLGSEEGIARIIAYGRTDCCYEQSIPLDAEVSTDGDHFDVLATRDRPFSAFDPWEIVAPRGTRARYVRFVARKTGFLVLSEIEIRPAR